MARNIQQAASDAAPHQPATSVPVESREPEQPAAKPSVWDRLLGVRVKKTETARQAYQRLMRKVAGGVDLKDKEVEDLAAAMDEAGITDADLAGHRQLFEDHRRASAAAAVLSDVEKHYQDLKAHVAEMDEQIKAIEQAKAQAASRLEQASWDLAETRAAASRLDGLEQARKELLGE